MPEQPWLRKAKGGRFSTVYNPNAIFRNYGLQVCLSRRQDLGCTDARCRIVVRIIGLLKYGWRN